MRYSSATGMSWMIRSIWRPAMVMGGPMAITAKDANAATNEMPGASGYRNRSAIAGRSVSVSAGAWHLVGGGIGVLRRDRHWPTHHHCWPPDRPDHPGHARRAAVSHWRQLAGGLRRGARWLVVRLEVFAARRFARRRPGRLVRVGARSGPGRRG